MEIYLKTLLDQAVKQGTENVQYSWKIKQQIIGQFRLSKVFVLLLHCLEAYYSVTGYKENTFTFPDKVTWQENVAFANLFEYSQIPDNSCYLPFNLMFQPILKL